MRPLTLFDYVVELVLIKTRALLDPHDLRSDGSIDVQVHDPGRSRNHLGHVGGREQIVQLAHLCRGKGAQQSAKMPVRTPETVKTGQVGRVAQDRPGATVTTDRAD